MRQLIIKVRNDEQSQKSTYPFNRYDYHRAQASPRKARLPEASVTDCCGVWEALGKESPAFNNLSFTGDE